MDYRWIDWDRHRVNCRNSNLHHYFRLDINLNLIVRDNVLNVIIRGQLKVIVILNSNLIINIQCILTMQFSPDLITQFFDLLSIKDELELVLEGEGGVEELNEVGSSTLCLHFLCYNI